MELLCPRCNGVAYRVPRLPLDRLISLVRPLHRYQCQSLACRWQWCQRGIAGSHRARSHA